MTREVSSTCDTAFLTESLKKRLAECSCSAGEPSDKSGSIPQDLHEELLEALDRLAAQARQAEAVISPVTQPVNDEMAGRVAETIDNSLAQWQARITASFAQAGTRELKDQTEVFERLAVDLQHRQSQLDGQRQDLERELTDTLRHRARLARQRKTLAKEFRAQRAELQLAAERSRQAIRDEVEHGLRQELGDQSRAEAAAEIELHKNRCLEQELAFLELQQAFDAAATEHQVRLEEQRELQTKLEASQAARDQNESEAVSLLEGELGTALDELAATRAQLRAIEEQLDKQQQAAKLRDQELFEQLQAAQQELAGLVEVAARLASTEQELHDAQELLALAQNTPPAEPERLPELEAELAEVRSQLAAARAQLMEHDQSEPEQFYEQIEELEEVLRESRQELVDLRGQNADLAAQVAKYQVAASAGTPKVGCNQESLSWEERKKLIMKQLEDETDSDGQTPEMAAKRVEIEEVLRATNHELERRDREIMELQSIVEQQSNTREGVAIGAAAIAQMLDSDELIQQERQKLKDIQAQWEEKLRRAEIDLSMERAKLARERTQLEAELEQASVNSPELARPTGGEQAAGQGRTRKWLEHLGLKDDRK